MFSFKKENRCLFGRLLRPILFKLIGAKKMHKLDQAWMLGYFLHKAKSGAYLFLLKSLLIGAARKTNNEPT